MELTELPLPPAIWAATPCTAQALILAQRQRIRDLEARMGASDHFPNYAFTTLNVRRDWAEDHEAELMALLRATARAGRWLFDSGNAAAAQAILAQATGLPTAEVAETYRLYVQQGGVLSREGEIVDAGMAAVLDVMREENLLAAAPAPDWYVDRSYWLRAQADLTRQR